jgi:hypothetical protein
MTMRILCSVFLLWSFTAFGDNLLPGGSFETPAVHGRMLKDHGGDPTNNGRGPGWISFIFQTSGTGGGLTGGLTNEVAHSGAQSLFIDFNHVSSADQSATLVSNFFPVVSGSGYEVGIWGRTDAKDLVDPQGRSAYLKLEIDYFAKDANTSVGEPFYAVQPLPGSKNHDPFFKPDSWNRFFVKVTTPPGAVFAQITWRWETESDSGEINGIMFFDDAEMTGPANPVPNLTPSPVEEPAPEPSASPAAQ